MKYTAFRIPCDVHQPIDVTEYDDEADGSLQSLAGLPTEGYVDIKTFPQAGVQLVYDDMGLMKHPQAPVNTRAMALWATLAGMDPADFVHPLVGDYGVIGVDAGGETKDVPPLVVEAMKALVPLPGNNS